MAEVIHRRHPQGLVPICRRRNILTPRILIRHLQKCNISIIFNVLAACAPGCCQGGNVVFQLVAAGHLTRAGLKSTGNRNTLPIAIGRTPRTPPGENDGTHNTDPYLDFEEAIANLKARSRTSKRSRTIRTTFQSPKTSRSWSRGADCAVRHVRQASPLAEDAGCAPSGTAAFARLHQCADRGFPPLAGDRYFAGTAIVAGIGAFRGRSVAIIGHEKGSDTRAASGIISEWRGRKAIARPCA